MLVDNSRADITKPMLSKLLTQGILRELCFAGRQASSWSLGRIDRCAVGVDGCNWRVKLNASEEVRLIAQPIIEDAGRKYHLRRCNYPRF